MHEVAEIDVPLTEMVSELEMMQLKQHLLIEQFRLKGEQAKVELKNDGNTYDAWVYYFNQSVEDLEFMPKGDFLNEYHK